MADYYLGIDQGITLTTAVLVDRDWRCASKASVAHRNSYPKPGWVEQDPEEIYQNVRLATAKAMAQTPHISAKDIKALGLDHQGETCCIWEKESGKAIHPALVWQDRRTATKAERLKKTEGERIRSISGMRPDAYYSATKLAWLLDQIPEGRKRVMEGELLLGTLNSYIFWRLSGGRCYKTDPASASCMMLMDLADCSWSEELVENLLGISPDALPTICDNAFHFGESDPTEFFGVSIPIEGSTTDSSAAIIGGGCFGEGTLKTSYGTGNFMSLQSGQQCGSQNPALVSDCIWREEEESYYRLRGACYTAGAAVEWLRDGIKIINHSEESDTLSQSVEDSQGLYFVPAFTGLATPYWDPCARGSFIGITAGTTRAHMVRAVLEAVAYQVAVCYRALRDERGEKSPKMRADGGMVENDFLMQFQADVLGIPVEIPEEKESAAYGAACIAAYADSTQ